LGIIDRLTRGNKQVGVVEQPYNHMVEMDPGLPGPGNFPMQMDPNGGFPMDPMMMANNPQFSNYQDQAQMAGLAAITLDNDQIIEDFASQLRGYIKRAYPDAKTGEIKYEIVKTGEPFCNDKGVNELRSQLAMRLSKVWILTNIPKKEYDFIYRMMIVTGSEIADMFVMNAYNWEIDFTRASSVTTQFTGIVYANLLRGSEGGEREKLYSKNIQMTSTMPHMMPPKKESAFSI